MKNADKPALPTLTYNESSGTPNGHFKGLTKREYFAAMVIQGKNGDPKEIAEHAVWVADELLKQLESTPKE